MINQEKIDLILGRNSEPLINIADLRVIVKSRILITGSKGSLGNELVRILEELKAIFLATDIDDCDVTNLEILRGTIQYFEPDLIVHLAADKHAPSGEVDPKKTFSINAIGTNNVIVAKNSVKSKVKSRIVLASTCKACDPETVYGASKLIAERLILNDGNTIARFYNVVETEGNVFEIWNRLQASESIPVAPCYRYFISKDEAISLLIRTMALSLSNPLSFGRYTINPGPPVYIPDLAKRLYSNRKLTDIPPRRGDRISEPLLAAAEKYQEVDGKLWKIESPYDHH
jgi:FlaA1/EpsC-like NDP-sugar epimerase